jgi:hypothetical protein
MNNETIEKCLSELQKNMDHYVNKRLIEEEITITECSTLQNPLVTSVRTSIPRIDSVDDYKNIYNLEKLREQLHFLTETLTDYCIFEKSKNNINFYKGSYRSPYITSLSDGLIKSSLSYSYLMSINKFAINYCLFYS